MVIFGVALAWAARKRKWSTIGCPGIAELAGDAEPLGLGLQAALEGDALRRLESLDAGQPLQEIEVPHGAAVFAVGHGFEPDLLLPPDSFDDRLVLDLAQRRRVDLAAGAALARLLQLRRTQQAADMVGAERRRGPLHGSLRLPRSSLRRGGSLVTPQRPARTRRPGSASVRTPFSSTGAPDSIVIS
jgi:hypothetical protein